MTEKQGGSDVRANTTRAEAAGDRWWQLTGHKWFCSYPPCDVFLVLAQAPAGSARVDPARTSEPPCFSVIAMPHSAPRS